MAKKTKGWLDQYQEGGVESRQGGYTDIPFKYNSAWGGQFQLGGNVLPGSVGFTYARTHSPAPSEGPYAKKTMPSAQNGSTQNIGESSRESMLKFYGERPQELQVPEIEESIKKIKVKGKSPRFMDIFQGGALGYHNPISNVIAYNTDPELTNLEGGVEETLKHEFGHEAFSNLPKEMQQIVKESILPSGDVAEGLGVGKKFAKYVTRPTEFYTRRRSAMEAFGLDPSKKVSKEQAQQLVDFTNAVNSIYTGKPNPEENYKKFKQTYPDKVEMLDKFRAYPGSEEAYQYIKSIKNDPDTHMRMLNDVTAVPGETVPMAQDGKKLPYDQWMNKYNLEETPDYNLKRAWELGYTPDETGHLPTVDNQTGQFLKAKGHPTIQKELDWYNSPEGAEFRSKNAIDSSGKFFKYVPKGQNGQEMKYYQEGLDWKPKTISRNGGWLDKYTPEAKKGDVIKDDRGQWAHPGEITEIGSNRITMQGVPYPVLGISDQGDMQMMYPEQEYKFKGKKVTEFPMTKQTKKVNQNEAGGWLNQYK